MRKELIAGAFVLAAPTIVLAQSMGSHRHHHKTDNSSVATNETGADANSASDYPSTAPTGETGASVGNDASSVPPGPN